MSKVSPLVNGENTSCVGEFEDATFNMVAISDSRSNKAQDFPSQDKCTKLYSCDFDHMYASVGEGICSSNQDKDKEIKYLKDLLLLHLDLIQQQSEQLVTKDKQIESLQKDLNNTMARCQRLERRVTLRKQYESDPELSGSCNKPSSPQQIKENSVTDNETGTRTCLTIPVVNRNDCESQRGPKRSLGKGRCINGDLGVKRRASTSSGTNFSMMIVRKRRTVSVCSDKNKSISSDNGLSDDTSVKNQHLSDDLVKRNKLKKKLKTDINYYSIINDEKFNLTIKESDTDDVELKSKCEQVMVPQWREKIYTPLYSMEGTENLAEEVFLKRHQRLELDEKRRKRWDIQRIREQHQIDKLKQRERRNSQNRAHADNKPISSFYPAPEDLQEIYIQDNLPVCVFGMQMPVVEPSNFTKVWSVARQQKSRDRRQRRKRRRQINS